jgi:hypothetical protein
MKEQAEFSIGGMVSVWIGNFKTDAEFDDYMNLSKDFEKDFGFRIENRSIREAAVEERAKRIQELVIGFSNWKSFASPLVEAARAAGIEKATTMIVFYCLNFVPDPERTNADAPLKFLGGFPFS